MSLIEETIDATLDANGQLHLANQSHLPPGPVRVTIRVVGANGPTRTLTDVIREIRADQIARGFHGLTTEQLRQREANLEAENDEYDQEMEKLGALPPPGTGAK